MRITWDATLAWKYLNGIICTYKPPNTTVRRVQETIKLHLCNDLNSMKVRPQTPYVVIGPGQQNQIPSGHQELQRVAEEELDVKVVPNYADHVLMTGPRYLPDEIKLKPVFLLPIRASGLMLFGINKGCGIVRSTNFHQLIRVYQIGIRLGYETDTGWYDEGMGIVKAKYAHVPIVAVNSVLSAIQAAYQRRAFEYAGVLPESQEAFELAKEGLVKPKSKQGAVIYGARTLDFNLPNFTIELHTLNETEDIIKAIVLELGRRVRSAATITSIKCVQIGNFSVDHSLSRDEWSLDKVLQNIRLCHKLSKGNPELRTLSELDTVDFDGEPIYDQSLEEISEQVTKTLNS